LNHYPRHVGDFIRATIGLSLAERGAYNALLDQYYANEAPLPLDRRERHRMAGASSKAERDAVDYVVSRFFAEQPDGWHNRRADAEIAAYQARAELARKNGANGGRPPNRKETESVISGNPELTGSKASQEPVTSNQEPEDQKRKAESRPRKRGSPLPDDWQLPDDWLHWAMTERPGWTAGETLRVSLIFRDHWQGNGESRANWASTWQNWVRRERCGLREHKREKTLAEKRAENMADLTGQKEKNGRERVIDITAARVDRADFPALSNALREPGGDYVGGHPEGGISRDVA
jgi:uncharacterized protein YdaU (DUF1376 family)